MEIKPVTGASLAVLFLFGGTAADAQAPAPSVQIGAGYGKLPLSFEPNRGQAATPVRFIARGAGYTISLSPTSAMFALRRNATGRESSPVESAVVRMDLLGANPDAAMRPFDKLPGIANYLMGSKGAKWPTNLPTYAKTRSLNVYPGIDLVYYGTQGRLEYDFVLAPGADPSRIRLKFDGATPVVDSSGGLVLSLQSKDSPNGIRFPKPVLYQETEGVRRPVDGGFVAAANTHEVRFRTGTYDHSRELVIDPVLVYSSYLGGTSQQSVIKGMALNAAGEIYVTGITNAIDFRTTPGVVEGSCPAPMTGGHKCGASSSSAAFVSKIAADGQSLVYSTYLGGGGSGPGTGGSAVSQGGSGSDFGSAIAVDSKDNAWVLGGTNSNNFPVTADAYSLYCEPASASFDFGTLQYVGELSACARFGAGEYNYSGSYSLFLVKLNPTGTGILYGTFLGGTQGEIPGQIALDAAGDVYVSGSAYNNVNGTPPATGQYSYPTTASAFQTTAQQNAWSAFVTELAPDGHSLVYSSFLSAKVGQTYGGPMAIGAGKMFIGGYTQSPTLPTTPGALSATCPGNSPTQCPNNGFVAEFDPAKSGAASLVFSTYLNGKHVSSSGIGAANSNVTALAADAGGNVYAGGSNQYKDFPATAGVLQPKCNSTINDSCDTGFVTKLNPAGALVWSTFYGSPSASGQYGVSAIALDADNNVYIANNADGAGDLPLSNGIQNYTSGVAYVAELSADASKVVFGSFFGSGANIYPTGLAVDSKGDILLAGYTAGALPLANAYQSTDGGGFNEGFFAKIAKPVIGTAALVSAASSRAGAVAAGSIVSAYGKDLATQTASGTTLPLPQTLVGTSVQITDSTGAITAAPLFFVSPLQVNFQIPSGVATGSASIAIVSGDGTASDGTVTVAAVAPGLFLVNAAGLAAADVLTVEAGGAQVAAKSYQVVNGAVVPLPIDVATAGAKVFLELFGTGISGRSSLANVSVSIGKLSVPAAYAGPQGDAGLDQVNVQLPASLAGSGDTTVSVTVDGMVSNTAHITIH